MKNDILGLFFLGEDKADNLLEAEQTGEKDGATVDGKGDGEANHPIDIQLFDKEGNGSDGNHKKDDVEPIATAHVEFEDALGEEVLQEGRDSLHTEAGAGGTYGIEARDDQEVEQDVDDHTSGGNKVELLEAAVGREQGAEDISR